MALQTGSDAFAIPTLHDLLELNENDWTKEDKLFKKLSDRDLDDINAIDEHRLHNYFHAWDVRKKVSVIIPAQIQKKKEHLQLALRALGSQTFLRLRPRKSSLEIVIVNDGPVRPHDAFEIANFRPKHTRLRIYCLKEQSGAAKARNVGLYFSKGDIIFFMDSDMILAPNMIAEHVMRHEHISHLALLSMREDIEIGEAKDAVDAGTLAGLSMDWQKDWRTRDLKINTDSTLNGKNLKVGETINIYNATQGFRNWVGTVNKRTLSSVFATHCVSVRREHLLMVGGFRDHYRGWGIEDRDLGSRLLVRQVKLVAVRAACARHIKHPESPFKETEMEHNLARYNSLVSEPYAEHKDNLEHQIADLLRDKDLYIPLSFGPKYGVPIPRFEGTHLETTLSTVLEVLLQFSDRCLRQMIDATSHIHHVPIPPVREGDLIWKVMLEEEPGGEITTIAMLNLDGRPSASTRLRPKGKNVGRLIAKANEHCKLLQDFSIIAEPSVDAVSKKDATGADVHIEAYSGISVPIIVSLDWYELAYYCIGAVRVQSPLLEPLLKGPFREHLFSMLRNLASVCSHAIVNGL